MGQLGICGCGRVAGHSHRPSFYALEVLPKLAKAGGAAWADDFARRPTQEQRAIIWHAVTGSIRYWARRMGYPDPIILESTVRPLKGGGYELVSTAPLRPEWGGDGRTEADAIREAKRRYVPSNRELYFAAERIKRQLAEMGITISYEDPKASLAKGQCGPQLRQLSAVYGTLGSSCRLIPNVVQPASAYRQVETFAQISAQCGGGRQ